MSSINKETRYASLEDHHSLEEQDLGHESDTTACSEGFLGKKGNNSGEKRSSRRRNQTVLTWVRWGTVVALQLLIVILLFWRLPSSSDGMDSGFEGVETGGDINGLFKTLSHKITPFTPEPDIYMPNMSSTDPAHRLKIQENWDKLMPKGSGSLEIKDWEKYPLLGPPVNDDPARTGDLYEATWTHALHCLYYHVDTYHQLVVQINHPHLLNASIINAYHASHCFEYLRNNILCSADMTLEGGSSQIGHEGLGQNHVCRNREEAIKWIEDRRVDDVQSIVGS